MALRPLWAISANCLHPEGFFFDLAELLSRPDVFQAWRRAPLQPPALCARCPVGPAAPSAGPILVRYNIWRHSEAAKIANACDGFGSTATSILLANPASGRPLPIGSTRDL
jgi:hypothetical protein